jgi:hypothetical protein
VAVVSWGLSLGFKQMQGGVRAGKMTGGGEASSIGGYGTG